MSSATNLVPGDTNNTPDLFVRDRLLATTTRVNVSSAGAEANGPTEWPWISANGQFVTFSSAASNLVPGDTNSTWDIFVRDLAAGTTERVSVSSAGVQGNGGSLDPSSISADGRFVAFESYATNFAPGDDNFNTDIFVRDRMTGETTRASVSSSGAGANNGSFSVSISADGRHVAFSSFATNLVANDTNFKQDLFVRARLPGTTPRESVSTAGVQADDASDVPSISATGRVVAFASSATNLIIGDANGAWDVVGRERWPSPPGDINGDGVVDGADLAMLLGSWGPCAGCPADINGDGIVNGADLGILLGNWT